MKRILQTLFFAFAIQASIAYCDDHSAENSPQQQPNIVLFFIDDLGYTDLGCYGSTFYDTPNIEVCSPTRAALMTGKAPQRLGITQWLDQPNDLHLPLDEVTIGEALGSAGYKTGYIGKWHLGEKDNQQPSEQGFMWTKSVNRAGAPGSYFFPYQRKNSRGNKIRYWDVPDLADGKDGDYLNDALTDHALSFISQSKDQPFFLCFAHYAVHTPIQAPKELTEKYRKKAAGMSFTGPEFIEERNGAKSRPHQNNAAFAAMVNNLDTNVGRVLAHLESLSLTKNTIIVFTSDNGGLSTSKKVGPTSNRPLRGGKGWTYEGGIRIPTMISWPEKIEPSVNSTPAITMDLYPTMLELTQQKLRPKQHLDGCSLVSTINGSPEEQLESRFLAWTYPHDHGSGHTPSNAIRAGDWKLIQLTDDKTEAKDRYELYNLKLDPSETKNLAVDQHEKTHELAGQLADWVEKTTPAAATEK